LRLSLLPRHEADFTALRVKELVSVHWIGPMVIGVYVGILIDPRLRAWVSSKEWERQARGLPDQAVPPESSDEVPWDTGHWPTESDSDLFGSPLSDDRT
jgi:hypothetical protein